jgi:diadenosine tetraphosphate (Ap4A) HIT family hydrolase
MIDFSDIPQEQWLLETDNFFVIKDGFPVSPGHCLIISKTVYEDYFDLPRPLREELGNVILDVKALIEEEAKSDGYNVGFNCGEAAGQSVMHFHCHVIPRYNGDMENPKGGVRHCIPDRGLY